MESPSGWVYRVALNCARRWHRRRVLERRLLRRRVVDEQLEVAAVDDEQDGSLGVLTDRQREVVLLRHAADLTETQIAAVLGISRSTVSSTLRDAYRKVADEHSHAAHVRDEEGAP